LERVKEFFKKPIVRVYFNWLLHIGMAVIVALLIVTYVCQRTTVDGTSMETSLHHGDELILEKFVYKFKGLKRGDIVSIKSPDGVECKGELLIKRIVALEGDSIEIKEGIVYVNNEKLDEPYIKGDYTRCNSSYNDMVVPKGYIYVLGDNRMPNASLDSRFFGPISLKDVYGRAVFRFWPLSHFGRLN